MNNHEIFTKYGIIAGFFVLIRLLSVGGQPRYVVLGSARNLVFCVNQQYAVCYHA